VDHFLLLEIGSGGGQNFSFYERRRVVRVVRVEAVEPDEAMLASRRSLEDAPVPIRLARVPVEALPFLDAHSDSAVVMLVFYSVRDPARAQAGGHSCSSNMCARKERLLHGYKMRSCLSHEKK
jgi:SAM-dependent methyltransferase